MSPINISKPYDYLAPDGSEIRLLAQVNGGGLCHCTLPAQRVSKAIKHRTVDELWYFLAGMGEVWRKSAEEESVTKVFPGLSLDIRVGVHFQFRNTGEEELEFIIATVPPWPGAQEAIEVEGKW